MKTALAALLLIAASTVQSTNAQVTAYYQPTPYPTTKYNGAALPQDLNIVHLYDGWLSNSYNPNFVRDDKLQLGGWGDQYMSLLKFDITGLPANPTSVAMWFRSYAKGDGSTTVPFAFCNVSSSWNLNLTWSTLPSTSVCAGWFAPPGVGNWWGIDFTNWYQGWKANPSTNNGILMFAQTTNNQFDMYRSSRYVGDGDRPMLQFTFTPPAGMPAFKMPLPGGYSWKVTNEAGGYECAGQAPWPDAAHQDPNYFTIDFNSNNGGATYPSTNVPVLAMANGTVTSVGSFPSTGYYVTLDHGNGYRTRYLHFDAPAHRSSGAQLVIGSSVNRGDQIGIMGNGGYSTGKHLHVNFWYNSDYNGASTVANLTYITMDGWLLKSFQTECKVINGVSQWARYYLSSNTPTGN